MASTDTLTAKSIEAYLQHKEFYHIEVVDVLPSTNTALKAKAEADEPQGSVLIARAQTAGIGRKGRSFFAPEDTGIYMSLLLRPQLAAEESLLITTAAAVAASRAIEKITLKTIQIKWVNDLFYNGKKLSGILTEASLNQNSKTLRYAVLGIGINVCMPEGGFPEELRSIATALYEKADAPQDIRSKLIAAFLDEFYAIYRLLPQKEFMDEYIARSCVIGKKIKVISLQGTEEAQALGITPDAGLLVQLTDGSIRVLNSGEISIREI